MTNPDIAEESQKALKELQDIYQGKECINLDAEASDSDSDSDSDSASDFNTTADMPAEESRKAGKKKLSAIDKVSSVSVTQYILVTKRYSCIKSVFLFCGPRNSVPDFVSWFGHIAKSRSIILFYCEACLSGGTRRMQKSSEAFCSKL